MCRTFPDAADLFSGVNALCRYGIYRQSSTSENAVFVEIQQRRIVNSKVRLLSGLRESDLNKSLDDIFKVAVRLAICCYKRQVFTTVNAHSDAALLHCVTTILITLCAPHMAVSYYVSSNAP